MSSTFFTQAANNPSGLSDNFLGESYQYYKYINSPSDMGMTAAGDSGAALKNLEKDVEGLMAYVELLVTGQGKASTTGGPLGDKYFLQTGASCTDVSSGNSVTRSLYINNIPDGSIPFISSGMGVDFSSFEGLIPGTMGNLESLNPIAIFSAFMSGTDPSCQALTMETRDSSNVTGIDTQYIAQSDIKGFNACWFQSGKNPLTGAECVEAFSNIYNDVSNNDIYERIYILGVSLLALYLIMKVCEK